MRLVLLGLAVLTVLVGCGANRGGPLTRDWKEMSDGEREGYLREVVTALDPAGGSVRVLRFQQEGDMTQVQDAGTGDEAFFVVNRKGLRVDRAIVGNGPQRVTLSAERRAELYQRVRRGVMGLLPDGVTLQRESAELREQYNGELLYRAELFVYGLPLINQVSGVEVRLTPDGRLLRFEVPMRLRVSGPEMGAATISEAEAWRRIDAQFQEGLLPTRVSLGWAQWPDGTLRVSWGAQNNATIRWLLDARTGEWVDLEAAARRRG